MPRAPRGHTREAVYRFVRERVLAGRPPTVREVQSAVGLSAIESARSHLEGLVAEQRLTKLTGQSRGYDLPKASTNARPPQWIPLLGRVQAGALTEAMQLPEGYVPSQPSTKGDERFGLRVQGESMTGAGILPGDVVIVRRQATADAGDIVVAMVGDEATVKRLRLRGKRVELHAENPAFAPIIPDPNELTILGKVIEVRRYFDRP